MQQFVEHPQYGRGTVLTGEFAGFVEFTVRKTMYDSETGEPFERNEPHLEPLPGYQPDYGSNVRNGMRIIPRERLTVVAGTVNGKRVLQSVNQPGNTPSDWYHDWPM
jgi:hypothetical protein